MNLGLIIDTSTEKGIVIIAKEDTILFYENLPDGFNNSTFLLPVIQKGLHNLNLQASDLTYVAAGVGPGSYTGIRVCASVAKTMAYTLKVPLIAFSTLEGFRPHSDGLFAVIIDAKISGVYCLKGHLSQDIVDYSDQAKVINLPDFEKELTSINCLITPNSTVIKKRVEALFPEKSWIWIEQHMNPQHVVKMVLAKIKNKEFTLDSRLDLQYMRKTQAEIEKTQSLS